MIRIFPELRSALGRWLRLLPWRILMFGSPRNSYYGILTFDFRPDDSDFAQGFAAIERALALIAQKHPARFHRIKHDVMRIVVMNKDGAAFWPDLKACILTPYDLKTGTSELALSIVHEATHARLHACGIPYSPNLRERIENRCLQEEIAFAQLLPDASRLIEELLKSREIPWWSDSDLLERDLNFYRRHGAPPWIINWMRKRLLARYSSSQVDHHK